jgi:hypothetical protein
MKGKCKEQLFNGSHCQYEKITEDFCFWHSKIHKDDIAIKKYFPGYTSLKDILEKSDFVFEKASFTGADMQNIDMSGRNFKGAIFDKANLSNSQCYDANFQSASFIDAILDGVDFRNSDFSKAGFTRSTIRNAAFKNTKLNLVRFLDCDMSYSDFSNVEFRSTKLVFVNLFGAKLHNTFFSKSETQLKYCNVSIPDMKEYFTKQVLIWIKEGNNVDILKVIEFYQKKMDSAAFNAWLNKIISALREAYNIQMDKKNHLQMADILESVSKLYKMINNIALNNLLPSRAISDITVESSNYIKIQTALANDKISTKSLKRMTSDINNIFNCFYLAYNIPKTDDSSSVVFISLHSPLEIVIYAAPVIIPAIIKTFDLYIKMRLNMEDLAIKKIDRKLKMLELESKLKNEFKTLPLEGIKKISLEISKHCHFIDSNNEFKDYRISDEVNSAYVKTKNKKISNKKCPKIKHTAH